MNPDQILQAAETEARTWAARRYDKAERRDAAIAQVKANASVLLGFAVARADAALIPAMARELEHVMSQVEEERYPELRAAAGELFAIDGSVDEGAETWTQYVMGHQGVAKFVGGWGTDLPTVSLSGAKVTRRCASMGNAYQFDMQDLRGAAKAGIPLESMSARAARRAHEVLAQKVYLWGAPELETKGLLNHPNMIRLRSPDNGSGSSRYWADKTADQIVADVNDLINAPEDLSGGVYTIDTVLLPRAEYQRLTQTRMGSIDTVTIMEYLRKIHPGIAFEILNECASARSSGNLSESIAFGYRKADVSGIQPMAFRQYSPQERGLSVLVPCESRTGGVKCIAPVGMVRMESIAA